MEVVLQVKGHQSCRLINVFHQAFTPAFCSKSASLGSLLQLERVFPFWVSKIHKFSTKKWSPKMGAVAPSEDLHVIHRKGAAFQNERLKGKSSNYHGWPSGFCRKSFGGMYVIEGFPIFFQQMVHSCFGIVVRFATKCQERAIPLQIPKPQTQTTNPNHLFLPLIDYAI